MEVLLLEACDSMLETESCHLAEVSAAQGELIGTFCVECAKSLFSTTESRHDW